MAKAGPLVSIGMPVYNGARFLEATLHSILEQDFEDFELVVSDNASSDGTQDICLQFAEADRRIRYSRNDTNIGAARNYNKVFRESRGKYFKWAACDDLLAPSFLRTCVDALEQMPDVVLAYTRTQLIDQDGRKLPTGEDSLGLDHPDVVKRFAKTLDPMQLWHNPIFGLIRSDVLTKTRLIGRFLAADRCLIAELSLYGPFYEAPEVLFYRRRHAGNIGTSRKHLYFYDPRLRKKFIAPEWTVLREHFGTIGRSGLSYQTRLRLYGALLNWAMRHARLLVAQMAGGLRGMFSHGGVLD